MTTTTKRYLCGYAYLLCLMTACQEQMGCCLFGVCLYTYSSSFNSAFPFDVLRTFLPFLLNLY